MAPSRNKDTEMRSLSLIKRTVNNVSWLLGGTMEITGRAFDGWEWNRGECCVSWWGGLLECWEVTQFRDMISESRLELVTKRSQKHQITRLIGPRADGWHHTLAYPKVRWLSAGYTVTTSYLLGEVDWEGEGKREMKSGAALKWSDWGRKWRNSEMVREGERRKV